MKKLSWKIWFGSVLLVMTAAIYYLQFYLFHDLRNTEFYLLQDMAFIPLQILIFTLIVDQILSSREQQALLKKMNMVIGVFFIECGNDLIKMFLDFDCDSEKMRNHLHIKQDWHSRKYNEVQKQIKTFDRGVSCQLADLTALKAFLTGKKSFLLHLLENPNLLEHDTFTDLLWAVFHLAEELDFRKDVVNLGHEDMQHITTDMKRANGLLISEWLSYMKHLKNAYPHLYSLAVRMNPFDPQASPEIEKS